MSREKSGFPALKRRPNDAHLEFDLLSCGNWAWQSAARFQSAAFIRIIRYSAWYFTRGSSCRFDLRPFVLDAQAYSDLKNDTEGAKKNPPPVGITRCVAVTNVARGAPTPSRSVPTRSPPVAFCP